MTLSGRNSSHLEERTGFSGIYGENPAKRRDTICFVLLAGIEDGQVAKRIKPSRFGFERQRELGNGFLGPVELVITVRHVVMNEWMIRVNLQPAPVGLERQIMAAAEGMNAAKMIICQNIVGFVVYYLGETPGRVIIPAHLLVGVSKIVENGVKILARAPGFLERGDRFFKTFKAPVNNTKVVEDLDIAGNDCGKLLEHRQCFFKIVRTEIHSTQQGQYVDRIFVLTHEVEENFLSVGKIPGNQGGIGPFKYYRCLISHLESPRFWSVSTRTVHSKGTD